MSCLLHLFLQVSKMLTLLVSGVLRQRVSRASFTKFRVYVSYTKLKMVIKLEMNYILLEFVVNKIVS